MIFVDIAKGDQHLLGAILGQRVYREIVKPAAEKAFVVILSVRGARFANSSFLKATWLEVREAFADTAALFAHMDEEVREEFEVFLNSEGRSGLEALDWSDSDVLLARLWGKVEPSSLSALRALTQRPGSTAPELHKAFDDGVSTTAWTNRLNELHRNGLAFRERSGRAWRFYPVAREVVHG